MADGMHANSLERRCCTKCAESKPLDKFRTGLNRTGKLYRHGSCNACQTNAATEWTAAHRPHVNAVQLRRYHESKKLDDKFMERKRAHPREGSRRYRSKPGVLEIMRTRAKLSRQNDIVKYLIRSARARSVQRGRDFDLTIEWGRARWTGKCELTGIEFDWSLGRGSLWSPSIDRVIPALGYVQTNCRFVLQAVNQFKGAGSDEEMMRIAAALIAGRPS